VGVLGPCVLGARPCIAADGEDALGGQFDSTTLGIHLSWPNYFLRVQGDDPASRTALLLLRPASGAFPTINLIEVPGRFELSRASELVADSYRSVGLTDAVVKEAAVLPQGWAELEVAYGGGLGPTISRVLVIPRADSHLVLTMVDTAALASAHESLWRSIASSIQVEHTDHPDLEAGRAQSVPPLWAVLVIVAALSAGATLAWHHKRRAR
jgi:hypothetical protein